MHYHEPSDFDFAKALNSAAPTQAKAFGAFDAKAFDPADEVLSVKVRELIAIAVAATTQCPYCMDVHVGNAKKAGASREEVARAVFVASALRAGGAYTHGFLALKSYEQGAEQEHFHEPGDTSYLRTLRQSSGGVVESYQEFGNAVFDPADEVLGVKERELIAVAVAVTTQCPYCLASHVAKAKKAGANEEELARAVMVAAALRAGAAYTHGFLAMKIYDEK